MIYPESHSMAGSELRLDQALFISRHVFFIIVLGTFDDQGSLSKKHKTWEQRWSQYLKVSHSFAPSLLDTSTKKLFFPPFLLEETVILSTSEFLEHLESIAF